VLTKVTTDPIDPIDPTPAETALTRRAWIVAPSPAA
jgi:hypothetical protein